jgi:hypothetical protein
MMGIFIKNVEVVRKAREIAARRGLGLTATIDEALDLLNQQDQAKPKRRPTFEEMEAATHRFRAAIGLDENTPPITKADFDALYDDIEDHRP